MAMVNLRKLVSREILSVLRGIAGTSLRIEQADGRIILDELTQAGDARFPVVLSDEVIGWVSGDEAAGQAAALLSLIAASELEKRALGREVLDKYKEINLLYSLAEKLAACSELEDLARLVIDEARRMIRMSRAAVLVFNGNTGMLESIATFGHQMTPVVLKPDAGIIGAVFSSAKAEIVNDVAADPRCMDIGLAQSLICAPLPVLSNRASRGAIGVISLDSAEPIEYTAADLKLLTALAAQAAPPIEQALHYEGKLKEAREREELLRRQLQDLRIEIDQGRKARQVAEITDTDYFQQLQARARQLRSQAAR